MSCGAQLHFQVLDNFGVEFASTSQLAQVMCELLHGLEDLCFQVGDIVCFVGGRWLAWVGDGRGRVGLRMCFVGFTGFLLKCGAHREASSGVEEALRGTCATKSTLRRGVSGSFKNVTLNLHIATGALN